MGTSSRRNCGSSVKFCSRSALRDAVALAVLADELMKPATLARSRASGASASSPSTASCASVLFCEARIASTLSNCRSAGLDLRSAACSSAPLPARPVPNSLRKIVKRSRNGSRMMLLIRSRSTERAVFVAGSRYSPSPGPDWIWPSSGDFAAPASCGCVGIALDVALADQRLRTDRAEGVLAEVVVVGVVDAEDDRGLLVVGQIDRRDAADDDAADLDVHARDHERGAVEDRAHLVPAAVAAGAGREDDQREAGEHDCGDGDQALHGPGGRIAGSQSSRPLTSRQGALPSAGACEAPPGQRATAVGLVGTPGTRWAGVTGFNSFVDWS